MTVKTETKKSFSMMIKIKIKVSDPEALNQWDIQKFKSSGFKTLYDAFTWAEDFDLEEENVLEIHITQDLTKE